LPSEHPRPGCEDDDGEQDRTYKGEKYDALVAVFTGHANRNSKLHDILEDRKKRPPRNYFGPESDAHRHLKEYIAENASTALNEPGLKMVGVEYKFATNDRADVVLEDADGKIIGVEIEIEQGPEQLDGLLQAIKYRFMLAPFTERTYEQTRGFLIAYSLSDEIRDICEMYEIEHFTIDRHIVESWAAASCQ
jgi:RecB family endonuclease NucS